MIWPIKIDPSFRYRFGIASRGIAAIVGGYGLAASATAWLALLLPLSRVDAVITATLLSFIVYTCAVLWVFAARNAWQAWLGIVVPTVLMTFGALWCRGTV